MFVNFSCVEQTPAGDFLGRIYYHTPIMDVFTKEDERSGFPHDGGQHSLQLRVRKQDIEAFLQLVKENYGSMKGCDAFIAHCRSKMQ